MNRERSRHYYQTHLKDDKVTVHCDFCNKDHTIRRQQYESNVSKNGRFICIKENGSIVGKKSKDHLRNPYAAGGKKKCNGPCGQIKPYEEFGKDKSRSDGYSSRCKACRAAENKQKYHDQKSIQTQQP